MFKRTYHPLFLFLALTLFSIAGVDAQTAGSGLWKQIEGRTPTMLTAERSFVPERYRTFRLNKPAMRSVLRSAPEEFADPSGTSGAILTLPMPDGTLERFRIERTLNVEPALLEQFPELGETYRGQGIDDPTATVRFDFLPSGFHSMILSSKGTVLVDPSAEGSTSEYISYYKRDAGQRPSFSCEFNKENTVDALIQPKKADFHEFIPDAARPEVSSGTQLRTYRLAVAATSEYTSAVGGGTVAGALAAQVLIMNRVNAVYERDLAIRMVIVANNNLIVYAPGTPDPYTNSNGLTMLGENQANVNAVIGSANYDIGHVFSTGGGGVARLNSPCGPDKARGVTGLPNPTGDAFAIDYVAHEMGHQFGGVHTFNATTGNCEGSNRFSDSAYEPGSGVSIMGYAGICDSQNLAGNSIDTFHVKSLESIFDFTQTGNGNSCAAVTGTLNTPPSVTSVGGTSFNIPRQTPFILTAAGTDINGDSITYDWQQYDLGDGTDEIPNTDTDGSTRPLFRVYGPTASPARTFPSWQYIIANGNVPPGVTDGFLTGESLPSIARTMNFQVIARDNRLNGGGVNTAAVTVAVTANGPFRVQTPNANLTWFINTTPTITWNVAGSNTAPVNTANVRITLSIDGGATFPIVLAESTPNDGSHTINSPNLTTGQARVKIESIGNIFFDVSDANFNIVQTPAVAGFLGGRVVSAAGRGLPKVYVEVTSGNPAVTRLAITNTFGYFQFDNLPFAQYTVRPRPRKGFIFTPESVVRNHANDALDLIFTGQ